MVPVLKMLLAFVFACLMVLPYAHAGETDSVYLFSYSTGKNNDHDGLHFAWSRNRENWKKIGNEFSFLRSDYGRWGAEKRMISPYLFISKTGEWQCVWQLNEKDNVFAHASSKDLVSWGRQSYPAMQEGVKCLQPIVSYNTGADNYSVLYKNDDGKYYTVNTADFKTYAAPAVASANQYKDSGITLTVDGAALKGQLHKVAWSTVEKMITSCQVEELKQIQNREMAAQDSQRFAGLKPVDVKVNLLPSKAIPISDLLLGIFFEDINYAADGGLYAELVQNRDFEYALSDKEGRDPNWNHQHAWSLKGDGATFTIDSTAPIHANNPHYAVLATTNTGAALINTGFDGMHIQKGALYNGSVFLKKLSGGGNVLVKLVSENNTVLAQQTIRSIPGNWKRIPFSLTANAAADKAYIAVEPLSAGNIAVDMLSLFPKNTFKTRENGLRADLAQAIEAIRPRFIRFPGGCVAHGDGLGNIYQWKNSIGPLEARKPQRNLWGYHQSAGLGYFEYFRFCEDVGAQPVPVIAAGVPCQNSGVGGAGQQGGVPMQDMDTYVQDIIDLVEYANGSVTTEWGKKRAAAGHPQPFNLKYIGIGNEDLITDVFEERYTMIVNRMKQVHPEITIIGTVGPYFEGTDYREGWQLADKLNLPMVDEHYYQSPGWFINNQDFYDKYDRTKSKVYLGEYAAHLPGRPNNLETALSEALYLTALERNGDVVSMASYAPLLAKEGHTQWNPNLIYFNNAEVKTTVDYEVQKLYGNNGGDEYLPHDAAVSNNGDGVRKRIGISFVRDSKTGDVSVKLINLLPVEVNAAIDLKDIAIAGTEAVKTVLTGAPADKQTRPVVSSIPISKDFTTSLPAYSFTVIRIKTQSKTTK